MTTNSTQNQEGHLSALFIKECRKFISALNDDSSVEELSALRQRIIQIRSEETKDNQNQA